MPSNADEQFELLNGFLDGVLTDAEQRKLDSAMRDDPSLEERLNELTAMRRSLLRGRSVGRLGPEFAPRVMAAARERSRGERQGLEGIAPPAQTVPARTVQARTVPDSLADSDSLADAERGVRATYAERAWRVWIPSMALAVTASLLLWMASSLWQPRPSMQPLVSNARPSNALPPIASSPNASSNASSSRTASLPQRGVPTQVPEAVSNQPISSPPMLDARMADVSPSFSAGGKSSSAAESTVAESSVAESSVAGTTVSPRSAAPTESIAGEVEAPAGGIDDVALFTMFAEIVVDPVAEQNEALRGLLEEHEILYADDLNLNSDQLDSLIASQMVGPLSRDAGAEPEGEVRVYFLRARAWRIGNFLLALESQYRDFPKFRLDMAKHPSVIQLTRQLSTIVTTDDTAQRLTFRPDDRSGLVSSFPGADRPVEYLDLAKRQRKGASRPPSIQAMSDATSYLILLVRPAEPAP